MSSDGSGSGGSVDETSPCCTGCIEQLSVAQRLQRVEVVWLLLLLFVLLAVDVEEDDDVVVAVGVVAGVEEEISRLWPLSQISRY